MRTKKGVVTSAKMKGTVSVTVHAFAFHPIYRKRFRRSKKFLADTNGHDVQEGDTVLITECRPISKRKYFKVTEVVTKVPRVSELKEEEELKEAISPEKVAPPIPEKKQKKEKEEKEKKEEKEAKEVKEEKEEKEEEKEAKEEKEGKEEKDEELTPKEKK